MFYSPICYYKLHQLKSSICIELCVIRCYHHLPNNRFLAGSADSFSHRLDSESVEVGLQASQHVVQLVGWLRGTGGRSLSLGLDLMEREDQSGFTIRFTSFWMNIFWTYLLVIT